MQSSSTSPFNRRVPTLDRARSRGIYVQFYDPDGRRYGIPTYPFHWAPKHLYTARQLRARGLRPGGQAPTAQILWHRGLRVAYLYRADLALPKRQATPAQRTAIAKALAARRTCGTEKPYYIPRSLGNPMNTPARHLRSVNTPRQTDDPVLAALRAARARRDQADRAIRILLAYARELATPRPYRLADLAEATGKSISGVRTAYSPADVDTVRHIWASLRPAQDARYRPSGRQP